MSVPNYPPVFYAASDAPAMGGRPRGNSAISSLLGRAGQALGAVGAPSSAAADAGMASPTTSSSLSNQSPGRSHPLSPTVPTSSFGHPHQHQSHHHYGPVSPPATASTTDNFLQLPPVSGTGTGTGTGTGAGTGLGIGHSNSSQRAVSAVVSSGYPSTYYQSQHSPARSSAPSSHAHPIQPTNYRAVSYAAPGPPSPTRGSHQPNHRALAPPDVLVPGLARQTANADTGIGTGSVPNPGAASTLAPRPMFDLPSIPTSNDDFASIPYLNSNASSTPAATSDPKDTMSQQQQPPPQYSAPQRRTTGYGDDQQQQQHHIQGPSQYQQHGHMPPRDYSSPSTGPHIKLEQAPNNPSSYQNTPAVPSVLQPGGSLARPSAVGANTAPTMQGSLPQQQDYQAPARPSLNLSHSYSRSSPAAAYDGSNPGFSPYTPTTPGAAGPSSSQFMSPTDRSYNAPGSQRNISHTPLGLADIRPRADSSLSDGMPSGLDFGTQNAPPGTSNYMSPWTTYAFDWCKWAPQGNGAGKVAIGSYLEDGHNFVSFCSREGLWRVCWKQSMGLITSILDSNP